jgi:hypothetical protein
MIAKPHDKTSTASINAVLLVASRAPPQLYESDDGCECDARGCINVRNEFTSGPTTKRMGIYKLVSTNPRKKSLYPKTVNNKIQPRGNIIMYTINILPSTKRD